ncbi:hypothetical protein GCM10028777_38740 [Angustibacter speluncae]
MAGAAPDSGPVDTAPALRAAAERQGLATWAELRRAASRRTIQAAVARGELVRVARGRYSLDRSPPPLRSALRLGGAVSHLSAAQLWMLPTLHPPEVVDVTVPAGSNARAVRGERLHWTDLDDDETRGRVTSPLRTVLDCARTLPFADALAVADGAVRLGRVDSQTLAAAAHRCTGKGNRQARRVACHVDGRAANPFESALRAVVIDLGLTGFAPQCRVRLPRLRGYVDVGDPRRRIALEADSFEFHGSRSAFRKDCRRYDELTVNGWLVLRFAWEDVMFDREWVSEMVAGTVALRDG